MERKILVKHYAGSKSYGTDIETSDTDFRGIFLGNRVEITTPFFNIKEWVDENEEDTKLFELNNFIDLACDNNPNILETLFVDKSDITISSNEYNYLRENNKMFLTKKIAYTTSAYAIQSLVKMKSHNKFVNNEDIKQPLQTDFVSVVRNFTENKDFNNKIDLVKDFASGYKLISYGKDIFGIIKSDNSRNSTFNSEFFLNRTRATDNTPPLLLLKFKSEEYEASKVKYNSYLKWKQSRSGSARNLLEDKFGYDSKDAMHLIRLMRIGYECITEGEYKVKRPDAKELLEIREGKWTYDEIYNYAKEFDLKIKNEVQKSNLPDKVDKEKAAKLILEIQDSGWFNIPLTLKNKKTFKPS